MANDALEHVGLHSGQPLVHSIEDDAPPVLPGESRGLKGRLREAIVQSQLAANRKEGRLGGLVGYVAFLKRLLPSSVIDASGLGS